MDFYFQQFQKTKETPQQLDEKTFEEIWRQLEEFARQGPNKKPPISKTTLRSLEICFIKKEEEGKELCTICLSKYKKGEQVFKLPKCKHVFHRKCLEEWFKKNNSCPICRYEFPTDDSEYEQKKLDKERHKEAINSIYL